MGNQNELKDVLQRLREAEQLLMIGVERGKLSSIERDLVLEKLRNSYEQLLFERKIEVAKTITEKVIEKSEKEAKVETEAPIQEPSLESKVKPTPEEPKIESNEIVTKENPIEIEVQEKEVAPHIDELVLDEPEVEQTIEIESTVDDAEEIETVDFEQPRDNAHTKPSSEILVDKYQGKRKFRNENMSVGKKDMSTKLQNKPILDLTKSIGINDKFMFTKELFHGNAGLYSKTIIKLNEFTDINDALFYIQENFTWDSKNEAASQLIELVRRKLMPGY